MKRCPTFLQDGSLFVVALFCLAWGAALLSCSDGAGSGTADSGTYLVFEQVNGARAATVDDLRDIHLEGCRNGGSSRELAHWPSISYLYGDRVGIDAGDWVFILSGTLQEEDGSESPVMATTSMNVKENQENAVDFVMRRSSSVPDTIRCTVEDLYQKLVEFRYAHPSHGGLYDVTVTNATSATISQITTALNNMDLPVALQFAGTSLTRIPDAAFFGCTSLKSISIPPSVVQIGKTAFKNAGLDAAAASSLVFYESDRWYATSNMTEFTSRTPGANSSAIADINDRSDLPVSQFVSDSGGQSLCESYLFRAY